MSKPASRLITLILLMQSQPNQKASELAGKLGVSVRTLHRYLSMLDEMGIPIYSERGPYGGFSLVRGYKMPPLVLTPQEAVAVYLGASLVGEIWGDLYCQDAQGAQAKLDHLLPDEQLEEVAWAQRSLVAAGLNRLDPGTLGSTLKKLRQAVRLRKQVGMLYRSASQLAPQTRRLDPYALVYRWGWWYVAGFCHLREAIRFFRADRILELALLSEGFEIPDSFDIHQEIAHEFREQAQIRARLRFAPAMAHVALANRHAWDALEEQVDGSVIVVFSAPDLTWAASTVLHFGPLVSVLEPKELRAEVLAWAQEIVERMKAEG